MSDPNVLRQFRYLKTVAIQEIDGEDKTYQITTKESVEDLVESIRDVGMLSPPIVKPGKGKYILISGFRRVTACRSLDARQISVRLMDPAAGESEQAKIAVAENSLQRPLNLVEQSRSVHLLSAFYKEDAELAKVSASLGLPGSISLIRKIRGICRLSPSIQEGILSTAIALPVAIELGAMDREAGDCFAKLFHVLHLSVNKQREILTFATEIALRDKAAITDILEQSTVFEILANHDLDRNQKAASIRWYLKQQRFPALSQAEENFKQQVKGLSLNSDADLIPPKYFEGNVYTLSMRFTNMEELERHCKTAEALLRNPGMQKILEKTA